MVDTQNNTRRFASDQWIALIFSVPWLEVVAELYKLVRRLWQGLVDEGMYEVPGYESTPGLLDYQGTRRLSQAPPRCELLSPFIPRVRQFQLAGRIFTSGTSFVFAQGLFLRARTQTKRQMAAAHVKLAYYG